MLFLKISPISWRTISRRIPEDVDTTHEYDLRPTGLNYAPLYVFKCAIYLFVAFSFPFARLFYSILQ
jgi:hypothetical protein